MTAYYVDNAAGNDGNAGTATGTAWKTFQKALDTAATAGDIVYFKAATEVLAVTVDDDTNSGSASGFIRFIGVNASWANDGTRMVINGNSAATNCLKTNGKSWKWYENFEFKNATGDGVGSSGYSNSDQYVFSNCLSHNNGGAGWQLRQNGINQVMFFKCAAYSNTTYGWRVCWASFHFCRASSNTLDGFWGDALSRFPMILNQCETYNNGGKGVINSGFADMPTTIIETVIDNNTSDGVNGSLMTVIIGGRLTNNGGYGIKCAAERIIYGYCYMPAAGQPRVNTTGKTNGNVDVINDNGTDTNNISGTDANAGYNAVGSVDFTLVDTATLRRTLVTLP